MYTVVDQQISLDVGQRGSRSLYQAARDSDPLTKVASEALSVALEAGSSVLLTTGFPIGPTAVPETDGPLGAVVLADALAAIGAEPILLADSRTQPVIRALCEELDLEVRLISAEADSDHSLLADCEPSAVIAVETPGRSADGSYRNMAGEEITAQLTPRDSLFKAAVDRGILTVGIGDGGNEIGMGTIRETVIDTVDHGETIACVTPVDELVVAGVSNWGAYGVACGLSLMTGRQLLHTAETERRLLAAAVEAGAVDGVSGASTESVDGIPAVVHAGVVEILRHCESQHSDSTTLPCEDSIS